jgi:hypothetical protein
MLAASPPISIPLRNEQDENGDKDDKDNDVIAELNKRRKVRQALRTHLEDVLDHEDDLGKVGSESFDIARDKTNKIYKNLTHNREQLIDALTVERLARAANQQTMSLDDGFKTHSFPALRDALIDRYRWDESVGGGDGEDGALNWTRFGQDVSVLFRSAPGLGFMMGPLSKHFKERAVCGGGKKRNATDLGEMVRPDEIVSGKGKGKRSKNDDGENEGVEEDDDEEENEATNERIHTLLHYLDDNTSNKKSGFNRVDLMRTLVDPQDSVQSVENFFDFAFLIKDKRVMHKVENDSSIAAVSIDPEKVEDFNARSQMVLSLNMTDLKLLGDLLKLEQQLNAGTDSAAHGVSSSSAKAKKTTTAAAVQHCPLHRSDGLYNLTSAHEQADFLRLRDNAKVKILPQGNKGSFSSSSSSTNRKPKQKAKAKSKRKKSEDSSDSGEEEDDDDDDDEGDESDQYNGEKSKKKRVSFNKASKQTQ